MLEFYTICKLEKESFSSCFEYGTFWDYKTRFIYSQVVLLNPVCVVIYTLASWMFFHERVYAEEYTLLGFFGQQYYEYQEKVGTGLPFIRGFMPRGNEEVTRWRF